MPYKPRTLSDLKNQGKGRNRKAYDTTYERRRQADPVLAASKSFRNSRRWQKFRGWFKKKYPICCDPLKIHPHTVEQTAQVHHIIGISERPDLGLVESNCAALCVVCHNKIEGLERSGKPTKHLFKDIERFDNGWGAQKSCIRELPTPNAQRALFFVKILGTLNLEIR